MIPFVSYDDDDDDDDDGGGGGQASENLPSEDGSQSFYLFFSFFPYLFPPLSQR
jgi:hypothetical protein